MKFVNAVTLFATLAPICLTGCLPHANDPLFCEGDGDCAADMMCDVRGDSGPANTCIARPIGCVIDMDCVGSAEGPYCALDGRCVACLASANCADANQPICDQAMNVCVGCDVMDRCAADYPDAPVCAGEGSCVQCADNSHCTSPGAGVCDGGVCRGCQANADCTSQACDRDTGECLLEDDVVYVDGATGVDNTDCTVDMKCATIGAAVQAAFNAQKPYVVIADGVYAESVTVDTGQEITLIGPANVGPPLNSSAVVVNNGSNVTLRDMTLSNATGMNAHGVDCLGPSSRIALWRTDVRDNAGTGVLTSDCEVAIERSTIARNGQGGISLTESLFEVRNNIILGNGTAGAGGSLTGGVKIVNVQALATQIFEFNTVADSQIRQTLPGAGVFCMATTPMTASNNIVYVQTGTMPIITGTCTWEYSNIEGGDPGMGNIDADPMFVDLANSNAHLLSGSPSIDAADPAATLAIDIDGDARPQGEVSDMGADEYTP